MIFQSLLNTLILAGRIISVVFPFVFLYKKYFASENKKQTVEQPQNMAVPAVVKNAAPQDAISERPEVDLAILPNEIWLKIFSLLHPEELKNTLGVNKFFSTLYNEPLLWENLIPQYFPSLKLPKAPDYKKIFQSAFKSIFRFYVVKEKGALGSLNGYHLSLAQQGNLAQIELTNLVPAQKRRLYFYAASFGHADARMKLDIGSWENQHKLLYLAVSNGNEAVVKQFIHRASESELLHLIKQAIAQQQYEVLRLIVQLKRCEVGVEGLRHIALLGNPDILKAFGPIESWEVSIFGKNKCQEIVYLVAKQENISVLNWFYKNIPIEYDELRMLNDAIENDRLKLLPWLFRVHELDHSIPDIIATAVKQGKISLFESLWEGSILKEKHEKLIFTTALKQNQRAVLKWMYEKYGHFPQEWINEARAKNKELALFLEKLPHSNNNLLPVVDTAQPQQLYLPLQEAKQVDVSATNTPMPTAAGVESKAAPGWKM